MQTGMKPSDYQEIGHYLRDVRESLRASIPEAAAALHIRTKYIESIEAGRLEDLPGKSYTRGYIKNYAHYLRLDVDKVLEAYGMQGAKVLDIFIPEPTLRQNLPTNWLLWLSIIGLFSLYAYWYFHFHDRTTLITRVPDVPAKLAHLLDKTPQVDMDRGWRECLISGDFPCFTQLELQALNPPLSYDEFHTAPNQP